MIDIPVREPDHREATPWSQAKELGKVDGSVYLHARGREYRIERDWDGARHLPGERVFTERVKTEEDGYEHETVKRWRGLPVPVGTYDALVAAEAAKRERAAVMLRPGPVNELTRFPVVRVDGKKLLTDDDVLEGVAAEGGVIVPATVDGRPWFRVEMPAHEHRPVVDAVYRIPRVIFGRVVGPRTVCEGPHDDQPPFGATQGPGGEVLCRLCVGLRP